MEKWLETEERKALSAQILTLTDIEEGTSWNPVAEAYANAGAELLRRTVAVGEVKTAGHNREAWIWDGETTLLINDLEGKRIRIILEEE